MSYDMQKIFLYAKLAAQALSDEKVDNSEEMKTIREELDMTHDDIINKAAKATIKIEKQ